MTLVRLPRTKSLLPALLALGSALHCAPEASSELIAYDGFDYTLGGILGSDLLRKGEADEYWSGPWADVNRKISPGSSAPIVEGSLSYTDASGAVLATSGNHVHMKGGPEHSQDTWLGRQFRTPPPGEPGTVVYISAIAQRVGELTNPTSYPNEEYDYAYPFGENLYPAAATIATLKNDAGGYGWDVRVGNPSRTPEESDTWKMQGKDVGKQAFEAPGPGISFSEAPALVVLRIEFTAETRETDAGVEDVTGTHLTLYVNPLLESEEANADQAIARAMEDEEEPYQVALQGISLMATPAGTAYNQDWETGRRPASEMLVDEIRVGTTWAAVTPEGEPGDDGNGGDDDSAIARALAFFGLADGSAVDNWLESDGIGWVHAADYPWFYSYAEAGWLYSFETAPTFAEGSWFWDHARTNWIYTAAGDYPWIWGHTEGWIVSE